MFDKHESRHILTSIVSYPERGEGGNNKYRGNCSPKLIEDLLGFFKPMEICDLCVVVAQQKPLLINWESAVICTIYIVDSI